MARIALLIKSTPLFEDDNYLRFGRELAVSGHEVSLISVDTLRMLSGRIVGDSLRFNDAFRAGLAFPASHQQVIDHDLVWILSLGDRQTFLDKYQLIYALPDDCRVINSLDAIMHLKSKYFLATRADLFPSPETYASTDATELKSIIQEQRGKWIVKPPAGSLGRDVFLVDDTDSNLWAVLQHMCGPENTNYTMVQRYVPEIEAGEKRVLIAAGEVIGQYQRFANGDHRTNVSQGAQTEHCLLTENEQSYCDKLAIELLNRGVYFAGIDLAYPWLIETNVVNPGGIQTIEQLTQFDHTREVVNAVMHNLEF